MSLTYSQLYTVICMLVVVHGKCNNNIQSTTTTTLLKPQQPQQPCDFESITYITYINYQLTYITYITRITFFEVIGEAIMHNQGRVGRLN